jgi:hypothetical protein
MVGLVVPGRDTIDFMLSPKRDLVAARQFLRLAADGGPSTNYGAGDRPEFVAGLVLQAIEEGQAQYFANDRLHKMSGTA